MFYTLIKMVSSTSLNRTHSQLVHQNYLFPRNRDAIFGVPAYILYLNAIFKNCWTLKLCSGLLLLLDYSMADICKRRLNQYSAHVTNSFCILGEIGVIEKHVRFRYVSSVYHVQLKKYILEIAFEENLHRVY